MIHVCGNIALQWCEIEQQKSKINDEFYKWLQETYDHSNIELVKVTRGKIHNYLGTKLRNPSPGMVNF
jgi:hypothetical protein